MIICALEVEREAFSKCDIVVGEMRNIRGFDCQLIQIGDHRCVCIKLPRMGLVEASVVTARATERFRPRPVAISGICAGAPGEAKLGTLIVADPCWEYQVGKWSQNKFKIEPHASSIKPAFRTHINQIIAGDRLGRTLKSDLRFDEFHSEEIIIAPLAAGSAVIASKEYLERVEEQHRKVAGIEMYGVYKAAELATAPRLFFWAKTVVDMGDSKKWDTLHVYGSILSSRFTSKVIANVLLVYSRTRHQLYRVSAPYWQNCCLGTVPLVVRSFASVFVDL
jgi:adenosylhomocysteine nucleosidase